MLLVVIEHELLGCATLVLTHNPCGIALLNSVLRVLVLLLDILFVDNC